MRRRKGSSAALTTTLISNHSNCDRQAKKLIERISYDLYRLKIYAYDNCPKAGVTPEVAKLLTEAEEVVGRIRRSIAAPLHSPGEDPYTVHEFRNENDARVLQDGSVGSDKIFVREAQRT